VHLLDDTTVEGRLIYAQTHYNLALFEIIVESPVQIPNFTFNLNYAQQIFVLGRDENLCLSISHGKVQYCNPFLCGRHHYMYVDTATPKVSSFYYNHFNFELYGIRFISFNIVNFCCKYCSVPWEG
jgi:hypothetical protein